MRFNDCCKEAFYRAIRQVLILIEKKDIKSIDMLKETLETYLTHNNGEALLPPISHPN